MKNIIPSALFLLLFTCLATPIQAKIYAQFTGGITTEGDTIDVSHVKWVELTGFSAGVETDVSVGTGSQHSNGIARFKSFDVTKYVDSATVGLMSSSVSGEFYSEVIIHVTVSAASGPDIVILIIKLKNVAVQSVSMDLTKGDQIVEEQVSLVYEAHQIITHKKDPKTGKFTISGVHTWNIATNTSTY